MSVVKSQCLTLKLPLKLQDLNIKEVTRIYGVGVKSIDIIKNTDSESRLLFNH